MPYKIRASPRYQRDEKSFGNNKPARKLVQEKMIEIIDNPEIGRGYIGDKIGFFKLSFGEKPEYRIIYQIYECCQKSNPEQECPFKDQDFSEGDCKGVVSFSFVRTREECNNLYKKDRAYFDETALEGFNLIL